MDTALVKLEMGPLRGQGLWSSGLLSLQEYGDTQDDALAGRGRQFLFSVSSRVLCVFVSQIC